MNKDSKDLLAVLGIPVLTGLVVSILLIISIPFQLFYAWVFQKFYIWFAYPLHAPHINLWEAWGIYLLIKLITTDSSNTSKDENWKNHISSIIGKVIATLVLVLVGYVIKGHIHA